MSKSKQKKNFTTNKGLSSRKDLRKQLRKEKKAKKNEYFKNKKNKVLLKNSTDDINGQRKLVKKSVESSKRSSAVENVKVNSKPSLSSLEEQNKLQRQEIKEKSKLERGMMKVRKKMLLEANKDEDKEIKKLEKNLKLNKRKTKTIPKSFAEEGLDYLLEVCDTDKLMDAANVEMNLQESGSEFEDDFAVVTEKKKRKAEPKEATLKKKKSFSARPTSPELEPSDSEDHFSSDEELEDSLEEMPNKEQDPDEDFAESDVDSVVQNSGSESESIISENNETENGSDIDEIHYSSENSNTLNDMNNSSKIKKSKGGLWEDIYGRTRDKEGNVIQAQDKGKYVPPHLRAQQLAQDAKKSEELTRLKKQLKGLINRLALSNMHSICNQIDELYMRNSRNDMNDTLLSLISEALVGPVLTAERLVMEHTMLIAILHANVGMEVGAHFLQSFVQKFDSLYKKEQDVENKELDNIVLIISHLYNFKVFHAVLMYNILEKLSQQFTEKEVELILLVLRSVGFSLRKDDPLALKDLVLNLQKKANESNHLRDNPRVRFMLDVLLAVKNNNMAKIPQYDPSHSEHLKKLLKTMIHKSKYVTELKVTLEDLLKADERGRWWIVGSAWSGAPASTAPAPTSQGAPAESQYSQSVLDLARKQRINTDTRRNIFCILMTAEDYLDAFEKLLRLGLKAQQEQEIIHVLVHCLLQEKTYNPYYAHLATHFCQADRKHQMTIQYHVWDRLKEMSKLSQSQITNLAKFLAHLFLEKALPISVLKVMQFSEMDKQCVRLLRQVLLSVLLHDSTEVLAAVFTRVSRSDKLHMFRESLRLFLHHFVLRNVSDLNTEQAELIKDRVRLAETALTKTDTSKLNFF